VKGYSFSIKKWSALREARKAAAGFARRSVECLPASAAAECLRYYVKQGTKYALVADKKVYTLEGHEADLDKYAAQKVTVKGALKGETLTVESVSPAE
jgi:hypothetical protein